MIIAPIHLEVLVNVDGHQISSCPTLVTSVRYLIEKPPLEILIMIVARTVAGLQQAQ